MKNLKPKKIDFDESIKREDVEELYDGEILSADNYTDKEVDMESEQELVEIDIHGIELLKERRLIPIGRLINAKKPYFLKYPNITDVTYNVYAFVSPMGGGKSTNTRSLIYYKYKFDPDVIQIIFDPMKMEFSKLSILVDTDEKREYLINDVMHDPEKGKNINIRVEPDTVPIFHIIPRFALGRQNWDQEEMGYTHGIDKTSIEILKKDGGFIFAEDASKMTEEQLFNSLNYRDLRADQAVHYYLRAGIRICNNKFGEGDWFVQELIQILRDNVKKFRDMDELDDIEDFNNAKEEKGSLSSVELQLIEKLEKYKDYGFFISNEAERKKYCVDWRKFIKIGKVLNISFMGFRKTEQIGEDLVRGQADLILERLIEISNEYYDALRKREQGIKITPWEAYLLQKWKVNLWFEESEIFLPRDCQVTAIKKWPCIKRLDYLMSFGRKYGFKNFGFITQRISKLNPLVFKEASHLFLGSMHGEERDQILSDFGVNRLKFEMTDKTGQNKVFSVRDIVTTLNKDRHEWVFINKATKSIVAIQAFDCPVG